MAADNSHELKKATFTIEKFTAINNLHLKFDTAPFLSLVGFRVLCQVQLIFHNLLNAVGPRQVQIMPKLLEHGSGVHLACMFLYRQIGMQNCASLSRKAEQQRFLDHSLHTALQKQVFNAKIYPRKRFSCN
jgi:hypothetical protein